MIVFSISHAAALMQVITFRLTRYREEKDCVLLILGKDHEKFDKNLIKAGIFSKIITFHFVPHEGCTTVEELKERTMTYYDNLLAEHGIDLTKAKELISSGDLHNYFYCYCHLKGYPQSALEMDAWHFSNEALYGFHAVSLSEKIEAQLFLECRALSGDPESKTGNKRYLYAPTTRKDIRFISEKATEPSRVGDEVIDFDHLYKEVSPEDRKKVLEAFEIKNEKVEHLILPNSKNFLILHGLCGKKAYLLYLILADLMVPFGETIMVKPHPASLKEDYEGAFFQMNQIDASIPIELLLYHEEFHLKSAYSGSYTALAKIEEKLDKMVDISPVIHDNYHLLLKTSVICELLSFLSVPLYFTTYNAPRLFLEFFYDNCYQQEKYQGFLNGGNLLQTPLKTPVCLVFHLHRINPNQFSDYLETAPEDCLFVFPDITSLYDVPFAQTAEFLDNLCFLEIQKTKRREDSLVIEGTELFCLYTKNPEILEKTKEYSLSRNLNYTGITMDVKNSKHQDCRQDFLQKRLPIEKSKYRDPVLEPSPRIFQNKKIILWGTGILSHEMTSLFLYYDIEIQGFCDNDPKKWGNTHFGFPIFSPEELQKYQEDSSSLVIGLACSEKIEDQIINQIQLIPLGTEVTILKRLELLKHLSMYGSLHKMT